jgi:hypothetical protein
MTNSAKGRHAIAISDRSGVQFPYKEMVKEWNGAFVHISEYEPKQPQLDPTPISGDPQGLQDARPGRTEPPTWDILPQDPFSTTAASAVVRCSFPNSGYKTGDFVVFTEIKTGVANLPIAAIQLATTLNGAISDSAATITLTDATYFPTAGYFYIEKINPTTLLYQNETIKYTGKVGNNLTGCVRGTAAPFRGVTPGNTTAGSHADGSNVFGSFEITMNSSTVPNPGEPSTITVYNSFNFTNTVTASTVAEGGGLQCASGPVVFKA